MLNAKCEMPNVKLTALLDELRASRFRVLEGARLTLDLPVVETLVNELIATATPPHAPVRSVSIHPRADDQFGLRIVAKAALIPPISLKLAIEQQPQMPSHPVLGLRMVTLGGLFGLASGMIAGFLPPGVTLHGERIFVDLRALAAEQRADDLLEYLTSLQVHTEPGRLVLHLEASVR
jgi:hypothetical protein